MCPTSRSLEIRIRRTWKNPKPKPNERRNARVGSSQYVRTPLSF
jgi:hypothetical protein